MEKADFKLPKIKMDHAITARLDSVPFSELIAGILSKTEEVFERLDAYSYMSDIDKGEFSYYRTFYREALFIIDDKIKNGLLQPVNLADFPEIIRFPDYNINAALFMGSFDPFQMTHIASALHYLASPDISTPLVFVVPEGHINPLKPKKSDYRYRLDLLSMQLAEIFHPFIVPLDIGYDADTIEIVRRYISLFPGAKIDMCHLLGSDALEVLSKLLTEDLRIWNLEAAKHGAIFSYTAFVIEREGFIATKEQVEAINKAGVAVYIDNSSIGTPSSTDFREKGAFSIVFPTSSVINHVEVLFRYNLNRPWSVCGLADNPNQYP